MRFLFCFCLFFALGLVSTDDEVFEAKREKDRAENNNVNNLWLLVTKEEEEEGRDESGHSIKPTLHPFQVIDIDIVTYSM